jgi:DNA-binding NtrC family response regulator
MHKDNTISILLIDDEVINVQNVGHFLEQQKFIISTATSGSEALALLDHSPFNLVITDLKMGDIDGVQVMKRAKELYPQIEVIIITGYATVNSAVDAMAQGAFYYLPKPIKFKELHALVIRATEKTMLRRGINRLKKRIKAQQGTTQFIGQNPEILKLKDSIAQLAQLDCNVLITGETWTGKELVAQTIYELSHGLIKGFFRLTAAQ